MLGLWRRLQYHKLLCMRNLTQAASNVAVIPIITLENVVVFIRKMWMLPSPRKRGLQSDKDVAVSMFYKSYMTFHFLLVWLGWVLGAAHGI